MSTQPLPAETFPSLLGALLRADPGRPLITAYDESTGERTELSVTTYANWVAKTANLLLDEYLLDPGDTIRVELPPHWLVPVFLGAAWTAGLLVTTEPDVDVDLVVTGPQGVARAPAGARLACSLLPFAVRFAERLPGGVDDYGVLWPGQPDSFLPPAEPDGTSAACRHLDGEHAQAELLDRARAASADWSGTRLITDVHPAHACGTTAFLAALVRGGSLVLVGNPVDEQWPARLEGERATDVLRSS